MRASVANNFFNFTTAREGFTPFMYADTLNLVTTGIGNLIDGGPRNAFVVNASVMSKAMSLPWKHKAAGWTSKNPLAGASASPEEIAAAWTATKLQAQTVPGFNQQGGFAYAGLTGLTLDMVGVQALFSRTLADFNATVVSLYPNFESWPADAQQATLSMAWAMGPAFFPALRPNPSAPAGPGNVPFFQAFHDAAVALNFSAAADHCFFNGGGGTPAKPAGRNAENIIMFHNADAVVKGGADYNQLFFPGAVPASAGGAVAGAVGSTLATVEKVAVGGGIGYGLYRLGKWWLGR